MIWVVENIRRGKILYSSKTKPTYKFKGKVFKERYNALTYQTGVKHYAPEEVY